MIPKVVHYCWFSGDKMPSKIRYCLKTWKKNLKGYEFRLWDASSFNFKSVPFVKDAYERRKWAFVTDYIRFYALYTEGGIYLDTDVAVYKNFDALLNNKFFAGSDLRNGGSNWYGIEGAIMGAEKGLPILQDILRYYEEKDCFILPDGSFNCKIIPDMMVPFFERIGYRPVNETQYLKDGVTIYSTEYFTNSQSGTGSPNGQLLAHHFNTAGWIDYFHNRGKVYNFFRKHDLLWIFEPIEKLIHKMKK